jgi:hypothetical protein
MHGSEVVAGVRLEGQHATGHAAMTRLVLQQRKHGLVPAMHAVKIADGQGASSRGTVGQVVKATVNVHGRKQVEME